MVGDNRYLIIRRILENAGGTPLAGDLETDLLEKYLVLIGGTPSPGDHFNVLLSKIVTAKGGTPTPGDDEWDLLEKWLETLGECRACGDSVYNLWQKILEMEELDPPVDPPCDPSLITSPSLENQAGQFVFLSWDWGGVDPASFRIEQSVNGGEFTFVTDVAGGSRDAGWAAPSPGSTLMIRIRSEDPTTCWVSSNDLVIDDV